MTNSLVSMITSQRSEIDLLRGDNDAAADTVQVLRAQVDALTLQLSAAQADAERYRAALENIEAESLEVFAVEVAGAALHPQPAAPQGEQGR